MQSLVDDFLGWFYYTLGVIIISYIMQKKNVVRNNKLNWKGETLYEKIELVIDNQLIMR